MRQRLCVSAMSPFSKLLRADLRDRVTWTSAAAVLRTRRKHILQVLLDMDPQAQQQLRLEGRLTEARAAFRRVMLYVAGHEVKRRDVPASDQVERFHTSYAIAVANDTYALVASRGIARSRRWSAAASVCR